MIKSCIFDLDGTLLDTLTTITYYMNKALSDHGLPGTDNEEMRVYVGKGARNLVCRTLAARGIEDSEYIEAFFKKYSDAYDEAPYYLTEPYDGIPELLAELKAAGIKLAVLSNKPDFATLSIIERFFSGIFTAVHGGREGVALKPAPDAVFEILGELSSELSECAYIGDSEIDVITAINAKPKMPIAVSWGFRTVSELRAAGAELMCAKVSELRELLLSK